MPRRRRTSRRRSASIMTALAVVVLTGILYAYQQLVGFDFGLSETGSPVTEVPPNSSWYSLYFTTPETTADLDNPTGGIPDRVAASLAAAQTTIDVVVYEFDLPIVADTLIEAAGRGVRVRVVTDTDSMSEEPVQALIEAGIPVVDDQRNAIMHDKFVVIDGAVVWTGSMNFTHNDAYRNNNNLLTLTSTRLAQNYTREFEEMFVRGEFGPTSRADTPHPTVTVGGTRIENYFSPEDGVAQRILDVLKSARSGIYFMAYSFTRTDFADALIERAGAGVTVQGVFEARQIAAGGDAAWNALTAAGLDVRQDGNPYSLHSKVFIIDRQVVVTGSYNFSKNAEESNDENVLIIRDPEIAAAYYAEWQKVWAEANK